MWEPTVFHSLEEGRNAGWSAAAVLSTEEGQPIFVVAPLRIIKCSEQALLRLHMDLHGLLLPSVPVSKVWLYLRNAQLGDHLLDEVYYYEQIWVHKTLRELRLRPQIIAVLQGTRERIDQDLRPANALVRLTVPDQEFLRFSRSVIKVGTMSMDQEVERLNLEEGHDRYVYFSVPTFIRSLMASDVSNTSEDGQQHYQPGQI